VKLTATPGDARTRLDEFVAERVRCSRAEARRLIDGGYVRVDGRKAKKGLLLHEGARVELARGPFGDDEKRPQPDTTVPLTVLHEDAQLVALCKPAGVPTHPLKPGERGTLANAIVARWPECARASEDPREGGVAHRLDTDTSGVLVAARSPEAWQALRRAFSTSRAEKKYLALVSGQPPERGEIHAPLAHATRRRVRALDEEEIDTAPAREAHTRYEVLARAGDVALVLATTTTGRMHQVRAHLAHLGHPLVGDTLYGGPPAPAGTQGHLLHAHVLTVPHPVTSQPLTVTAPLPADRRRALEALLGTLPGNI
jgi:23S rRNA pseudouridine1911/1915/1917 synthase